VTATKQTVEFGASTRSSRKTVVHLADTEIEVRRIEGCNRNNPNGYGIVVWTGVAAAIVFA
jgi:hypothetical protein